ncbi:hypothetical protein vseg_019612 [Gypsophila vaccaria]
MAAELVIWENLERLLTIPKIASKLPLTDELDLVTLVQSARGLLAAQERRNHNHRTRPNMAALHDHSDILFDNGRHRQLKKLSASLYEADDLLDEIQTFIKPDMDHRDRREGNERENQIPLVRQLGHAMARPTQEVNLALPLSKVEQYEKIRERIKELLDKIGNINQPQQNNHSPFGLVEPAHHILMGRREDQRKIVKLLLEPNRYSVKKIPVISMTGLPGVGKSALAKDIFNDQKIKSHFDLRIWISVSQITDEKEIIRGIVESCTGRSDHQNCKVHQNNMNPFRDILGCRSTSISTNSQIDGACRNENDKYERRLRKEIGGKLYLIILDDVCLKEWKCLRDLLKGGAKGSRILMTTRSDEVANLVNREFLGAEAYSYSLKGLSPNYSWILLKRQALVDSRDDERQKAGYEIGDICESVPLTIKVAARFLQGKDTQDWLTFTEGLKSRRDQGEDIMEHVLLLTYSDLSPHLRACFVYCSLFPVDFTFNKHDLISLWIAQGFVKPVDGESLEHVGHSYFMELLRRWLLEDVRTDDLGNILTCKMHRIVHNLATKFAAGISNLHLTDSGMIQIKGSTTKHVSVHCRSASSLKRTPLILNDPSLRTLIFVKDPDCDVKVENLISKKLISTYRRLRVLDLHDLGVKELPDSIGDHIHLRYLDVSKNDGLVTLPKSFSKLYNLQTLKLNSCPKLKPLAIDFGQLTNLKRFEVDECESLTCMPLGLAKLTQLQTLTQFVVGKGASKETAQVGLQALSELALLTGRLAIKFTGDWKANTTETKQVLCTKTNLDEVKISWVRRPSNQKYQLQEESLAHGETLEDLKPNRELKSLVIEGYKGNDFPSWANKEITSSLPKLVIISIEGCDKSQYLPPFGELAHLKKLTLRHMTNVQFAEDTASQESQVGGSPKAKQVRPFFISLKELNLHNFYNLKGWQQKDASIERETRSFPCLSVLRIWNCPNLVSFPSFIGVADLDLRNVNHLLLTESVITKTMPKSKLCTRSLKIKGCSGLKDFGEVKSAFQGLPFLRELVINSCDELVSLANDTLKLTSLISLEISNCPLLEFPKDPETHSHRFACFLRQQLHQQSPWMNLKFLRHLKLREIIKMEALPDGLQHVKSLRLMWISACQSLGSLPEWIGSLTDLRHLRIESCRALKELPEGLKDTISLMKVEISECPGLIERCREHTGEDWPKIKHAQVVLHKSRRYGYV